MLMCVPVYAQESTTQKATTSVPESKVLANAPLEIQISCNTFFKTLISTNVDRAFDDLLKKSPLLQKIENIKNLKLQLNRANELYGPMRGFEPVSAEAVSESLIRLRYLGLHVDFPMRWIITFYNAPLRGWIVINMKFDDNTEYLFSDE